MNNLLVICGPTATGKTSLGIKLAKKFSGEIVSADSRQVYKGMDIGTGKDLEKFSIFNFAKGESSCAYFQFSIKDKYKIGYYKIDGVKVWLYDVMEPDYQFNVADYVKCADLVIKDIWKRGKLPILVGGTGFYIKALIDGIGTMGIEPDLKLREKLRDLEIEKLREKLRDLDPRKWKRMNESDWQNPRRLIRAIEVAQQNQKSKTPPKARLAKDGKNQKHKLKTKKSLMIGLMAQNEVLYERIDQRVDERVKQGVIEEIEGLLKKGYNWENSVLGETMGYREWRDCFAGLRFNPPAGGQGSRLKEAIQKWKYDEHGYARRQMTWFRRDKRIQWIDINKKGWENKVEELVNKWYIGI